MNIGLWTVVGFGRAYLQMRRYNKNKIANNYDVNGRTGAPKEAGACKALIFTCLFALVFCSSAAHAINTSATFDVWSGKINLSYSGNTRYYVLFQEKVNGYFQIIREDTNFPSSGIYRISRPVGTHEFRFRVCDSISGGIGRGNCATVRDVTVRVTSNGEAFAFQAPSQSDGTFTLRYIDNTKYYVFFQEEVNGSWTSIHEDNGQNSGTHNVTKPNGTYRYRLRRCDRVTANLPGSCIYTSTASVTVQRPNTAPTISNISNKSTPEGTATGTIGFTVGDAETPVGSLTVTATSSNTGLIPNSGLQLGGSGGNRTIRIVPSANGDGTSTVTVTVKDGNNATRSDSFVVTVTNRPADLTVSPSVTSTGNYTVSWKYAKHAARIYERKDSGDWVSISPPGIGDEPSGSESFTKTVNGTYHYRIEDCAYGSGSMGPTLTCTETDTGSVVVDLPPPVISASFSSTSIQEGQTANFTWSSSNSTSCAVSGVTPVWSGTSGSRTYAAPTVMSADTTHTLTVTCIGGGGVTAISRSIALQWVNDKPTISALAPRTIGEDTNTGDIAFTVADEESESELLIVTGASSNIALVRNEKIIFGGSGSDRTVRITPEPNQFGTVTITLTVTDTHGASKSTSFILTVNNVNDPPVVSAIADQVRSGTAPYDIPFTVSDIDTPLNQLTVSATSGNPGIVPNNSSALQVTGTGSGRTLRVTPANNHYGNVPITVRVSDGAKQATTTFNLTIGSAGTQLPPLTGNLLATVADPLKDALDGSEYKGSLEGSFSVANDASFNYSIPIATPPGVNGIEPGVSLVYSSSAKNGLLGWGWRVSGLSKIHRCPADMLRDGRSSGIRDEEDYRYCLDGERLVEISSGQYRTESESFLHIQKTADYWMVTDRNGIESRYGYNADAREISNGGNTFNWHLDRIQDVFGNTLTVSYNKGALTGGNYHRPDSVAYTSNNFDADIPLRVVRFEYENRPDFRGGVIADTRLLETQRLASVVVESEGTILWSYNLSYQQPGQTYHGKLYDDPVKASRLASVERCFYAGGVEDFCQDPIEFDWTERNVDSHIYTDMDPATTGRRAELKAQRPDGLEVKVYFDIDNDGIEDAYYAPPDTVTRYNGNEYYVPKSEWLAIDVNGDGYKDIVRVNAVVNGVTFYLNEVNPTPAEGESGRRIAEPSSSVYRAISPSGVTFEGERRYTYYDYDSGVPPQMKYFTRTGTFGYDVKFADINADGLIDVVRVPPNCGEANYECTFLDPDGTDYWAGRHDISVAFNTGSGWTLFKNWYNLWGRNQQENTIEFMDMNGDGLSDIWGLNAGQGGGGSAPMYLLHNGVNAGEFILADEGAFPYLKKELVTGDFNGDGFIDFANVPIGIAGTTARSIEYRIDVSLGTGTSTLAEHLALNDADFTPFCGNDRPLGSVCLRKAVDFNHDGYDDIVEVSGCAANTCSRYATDNNLPRFMAQVWLSKGPSASGGVTFTSPIIYRTSSESVGFHSYVFRFEDFNNDGILEDTEKQTSSLKEHRIERFISAVTTVDVTYQSFAATAIQRSAGGADGDWMLEQLSNENSSNRINITQPRLLPKRFGVKSIEVSNGLGGVNRTEYRYKKAVVHPGWGNLGFGTIEKDAYTADSNEFIRTVSEYNQTVGTQYKVARKLKRERTYTVDANGIEHLLSDSRYRWKVRLYQDDYDTDYQSPHYHAYLYESSTETWDLDGTAIATTAVRNHRNGDYSCTPLPLGDIELISETTTHDEYHPDGVLKYAEAVTCDQSGSSAAVQLKAEEKNGIITLGKRRGLVEESKVHVWSGPALGDINTADFQTRTESYSYFASGNAIGSLENHTREPDSGAGIRMQTAYTYNGFGSIASITESWINGANDGLDFTSRVTSINENYDSNGRRVVTTTHPLLGNETTIYHSLWGKAVHHTDINNLTTQTLYDALGRPTQVTAPGNIVTEIDYRTCDNCFSYNDRAVKYVQSKTTGSSAQRQYLDSFSRTIGTRTRGFDGSFVYTAQFFNAKGQVAHTWAPFFAHESTRQTQQEYDQLGRVVRTDYPDDSYKTHTYNGLQIETTNQEGQTQQRRMNAAGWVMQSIDNAGTPVDFSYNGFGQLTSTVVNNDEGTRTTIDYDILGRKILLDDPNTGTIVYDYNALDLLASQTDAKGQVTRYTFDKMGRQRTRTDDASGTARTHTWHYDTQVKGLADTLSGYTTDGEAYGETYTYNALGLPTTVTANYAGRNLSVTHGYDSYHRPLSTTYPGGYQVANLYNAHGHLGQVAETDSKRPLWKAHEVNALGQVTLAQTGDGAVTTREYTPETGRIERIDVERGGIALMDQGYVFDDIGKLTERSDAINNVTQSLCYDNMNRLKAARTNGCSSGNNDFTYDALGNITSKLHVGAYQYNQTSNAGPHAVTAANGLTYHYDANGNLTQAKNASNQVVREVEYSAFNKPTTIRNDNRWTKVTYGPDQMRVKREDDNGRVTYYLGDLYEEVIDGGITQRIHTVGDFALHIESFGLETGEYNEYLHLDHLGSIVVRSSTKDSLIDQQAFGAWGQRLLIAWDGVEAGPDYQASSLRGYTGHEHLDNLGLIHMNGRVYDPELGRFLSPDPYVQAPYNTQSYNRYSYVFNNPLSYTDPTGYFCSGYDDDGCDVEKPTEEVVVIGHRPEESAGMSPQDYLGWSSYFAQASHGTWAEANNQAYNLASLQGSLLYQMSFAPTIDPGTVNWGRSPSPFDAALNRAGQWAVRGFLLSPWGIMVITVGGIPGSTPQEKSASAALSTEGGATTASPMGDPDDPDDEDTYENPGHHDPRGGPNAANASKSPLPRNHQELWNRSIRTNNKTRWAKEGTGKNTIYHRFQNDGRGGPFHWNGSTAPGARSIPMHQVPNKIIKL